MLDDKFFPFPFCNFSPFFFQFKLQGKWNVFFLIVGDACHFQNFVQSSQGANKKMGVIILQIVKKHRGEFWPLKLEITQRVCCPSEFSGEMAVIPDFSQIATFSKFFSAKPTDCRFSKCFPFFLCQGKQSSCLAKVRWAFFTLAMSSRTNFCGSFSVSSFALFTTGSICKNGETRWKAKPQGMCSWVWTVPLPFSPRVGFRMDSKSAYPTTGKCIIFAKLRKEQIPPGTSIFVASNSLAKCLMFLQAFGSGKMNSGIFCRKIFHAHCDKLGRKESERNSSPKRNEFFSSNKSTWISFSSLTIFRGKTDPFQPKPIHWNVWISWLKQFYFVHCHGKLTSFPIQFFCLFSQNRCDSFLGWIWTGLTARAMHHLKHMSSLFFMLIKAFFFCKAGGKAIHPETPAADSSEQNGFPKTKLLQKPNLILRGWSFPNSQSFPFSISPTISMLVPRFFFCREWKNGSSTISSSPIIRDILQFKTHCTLVCGFSCRSLTTCPLAFRRNSWGRDTQSSPRMKNCFANPFKADFPFFHDQLLFPTIHQFLVLVFPQRGQLPFSNFHLQYFPTNSTNRRLFPHFSQQLWGLVYSRITRIAATWVSAPCRTACAVPTGVTGTWV